VTDRRTDRILIARPRLHYMQRGKNHVENTKPGVYIVFPNMICPVFV